METVISGVKREGEEEEEGKEEEILFERSDICYIMTRTMNTVSERKLGQTRRGGGSDLLGGNTIQFSLLKKKKKRTLCSSLSLKLGRKL